MDTKKNTVFTIGHSVLPIEEFLEIVKTYKIDCIVDVRSTPYSKYAPQYNKESLTETLSSQKVRYLSMGKEFGARREEKELYSKDGYLDFKKVRMSKSFLHGVERIKQGLDKGFVIALMCTEKNPVECHRTNMVAKGLHDNGIEIAHITHDKKIMTQQDMEKELLDKFFPERHQISIFEELEAPALTHAEMVEEAYARQNIEIGYRINSNMEE